MLRKQGVEIRELLGMRYRLHLFRKTRLFISSEVSIYQIFSDEDASKNAGEMHDHMRSGKFWTTLTRPRSDDVIMFLLYWQSWMIS